VYINKKQQLLTNGWEERLRKRNALLTLSVAKDYTALVMDE